MSESATATYEWNQLPWRKLEVAVFKLERQIDVAILYRTHGDTDMMQHRRCVR